MWTQDPCAGQPVYRVSYPGRQLTPLHPRLTGQLSQVRLKQRRHLEVKKQRFVDFENFINWSALLPYRKGFRGFTRLN
jgi:hypothetical protein